jgi:hypothetical protein
VGKGKSSHVLEFGRFVAHKPGTAEGIVFVNNMVYVVGGADYVMVASDVKIDSNCFFGKHPGSEPKDAHKLTGDLSFVPKNVPAASWAAIENYRPAPGSPCAGSGRVIEAKGGRDLLGQDVTGLAPDRGALAARQR